MGASNHGTRFAPVSQKKRLKLRQLRGPVRSLHDALSRRALFAGLQLPKKGLRLQQVLCTNKPSTV